MQKGTPRAANEDSWAILCPFRVPLLGHTNLSAAALNCPPAQPLEQQTVNLRDSTTRHTSA